MERCCTPQDVHSGDVLSVSFVSRTIRELMEDSRLKNIWVEGEVRDYRRAPSGHCYFSLSEQQRTATFVLGCVMFRRYASVLPVEPKNGMKVLVRGSVDVYEPHGKYQLVVSELRAAGAGEKHLMVQRWKEELAAEGLFSPAMKRPLPRFPARIGVVTSPTGAARRDIEQVIARRFPVEILLSPTSVQGEGVHREIAEAIRRIDGKADVLIVGRGGGSFEDLFAFNHPDVVRAIAACSTPVVSAVGHEVDTSLADLAADCRAPTPSAAAEIVVPDRTELKNTLHQLRVRLNGAVEKRQNDASQQLEDFRLRLQPRRFRMRLEGEMEKLGSLRDRMHRSTKSRLERESLILGQMKATIAGMDPQLPLARGYAILRKEGKAVTGVGGLAGGDEISIQMADGTAAAEITGVKHDRKNI